MSKDLWTGVGLGLVIGGLAGYVIGTHTSRPEAPLPLPAAPVAAAPPAMGGPSPVELQQRILAGEQTVLVDPKNVKAWIALGNDYFDAKQAQKSVDAYAKALALDPRNPNVLTDQGVMYRELRQFEKAIENFHKAQAIDSTHIHSLFNLGVVYAHDLHEIDKARQAWGRLVERFPTSPQAAEARQGLEQLKGMDSKAPAGKR